MTKVLLPLLAFITALAIIRMERRPTFTETRPVTDRGRIVGWGTGDAFDNTGRYVTGVLHNSYATLHEFCAHRHATPWEAETCASVEFALRKQGSRQWPVPIWGDVRP